MTSAIIGQIRPAIRLGQSVTIIDLLTPDRVIVNLRAPDKQRLLDELARRCAKSAHLESSVILEALLRREQLGSTGMGSGIAIPHARFSSLPQPIGFFARLKAPVEFEAIDGRPVDLVFVLLLPAQGQGDHLNCLACVARRLRNEQATAALRGARDALSLYETLTTGDRQQSDTHPS